MIKKLLPIICLLVLFILFTQHTAWIEVLVYPYFANNGYVFYKDLIDVHWPTFIWFMQIVTSLFGYSPKISFFLTLLLGVINLILVWVISEKLWKHKYISLLASLFYAMWFTYFEGNGLWYDLFQSPFILAGFYFTYKYMFKKGKNVDLLVSGILFALAFFIKQSAVWIILMILLWILLMNTRHLKTALQKIFIFLSPFLVFLLIILPVAYLQGYLSDIYFWQFKFTYLIFPFSNGHKEYPTLAQLMKLLIPLAVAIPLLISAIKKDKKAIFGLLILGSSFMVVFPRWSLFHLQAFLPLLAILSFPHLVKLINNKSIFWYKYAFAIVVIIWLVVISRQAGRFYNKPIRFFEPSMYKAAEVLKGQGYTDFYAFNAPEQLYLLTDINPTVKPYVQNFAWQMEVPGVQERVVQGLEQTKIKYILFSPFSGKGGYNIGDYRPKVLGGYIDQNYHLKEKITDDIWVLERN